MRWCSGTRVRRRVAFTFLHQVEVEFAAHVVDDCTVRAARLHDEFNDELVGRCLGH